MKLVSFEFHGKPRVGALIKDRILDLTNICEGQGTEADATALMISLIGDDTRLSQAEDCIEEFLSGSSSPSLFEFRDVRMLAPIPRPRKNIICLGLNYADHARETKAKELPAHPVFFTKSPNTVIGPGQTIRYPRSSRKVDYEVELAFVFAKTCKDVNAEGALNYVFGYTIMNDVTARDLQFRHSQWFKGKSLDTFAPMGPYIATKDEIPDPHQLEMELYLNGDIMQNSSTSNMIFKIPQLIETITSDATVEPGEIVATGTPAGVGFVREPPVYLKPGDIVEARIERLGSLTNPVT